MPGTELGSRAETLVASRNVFKSSFTGARIRRSGENCPKTRRLTQLPSGAATVLFDPALVAALVDSHSLVHLELLADMEFFNSLEKGDRAVT